MTNQQTDGHKEVTLLMKLSKKKYIWYYFTGSGEPFLRKSSKNIFQVWALQY